jgi:hypothetical protein
MLVLLAWLLLPSTRAHALPAYTPSDLSLITDDLASTLVRTVSVGGDHHPFRPASPLGLAFGFDLGADAVAVKLPAEFKTAIVFATGSSAEDLPALLPLPKLNFHKGLPFGFDLGATFMNLKVDGQDVFRTLGVDVQWAFLRAPGLPNVAVRTSAAWNRLFFVQTRTVSADLLASYSLGFVEPYAGAGVQSWSGDIEVPEGVPTGGNSLHASGLHSRGFGGFATRLFFLRLTPEIDYSLAKIVNFGVKLSASF